MHGNRGGYTFHLRYDHEDHNDINLYVPAHGNSRGGNSIAEMLYNPATRSYFKQQWREYEEKNRLAIEAYARKRQAERSAETAKKNKGKSRGLSAA